MVDLQAHKQTISISNSISKAGIHIDGASIYSFRPYTCDNIDLANLKSQFNWVYEYESQTTNSPILVGITAILLNIESETKKYDADKKKWRVEGAKFSVDFFFKLIELSKIEIRDKDGKLVETMNIVSITYELSYSDNYQLSVPVGHGCIVRDDSIVKLRPDEGLNYYDSGHYKIVLETTAMQLTPSPAEGKISTVTFEVFRIENDQRNQNLLLVRKKTASDNRKYIIDSDMDVEYEIDMHLGTCTMRKLVRSQETNRAAQIEFETGQKLTMEINDFLGMNDGFEFVRTIRGLSGSRKDSTLEYFENANYRLNGKPARIIRVYERLSDTSTRLLRFALILVFESNDLQKIGEIFQFNVIKSLKISTLKSEFDISSECFLSNNEKVAGKDYAWFELSYPVSSATAKILEKYEDQLETALYGITEQKHYFNWFNTPRVEFEFNDESLVIRMLVLQVPTLFKFQHWPDKKISKQVTSREIAVDDEHCAKFCQIYSCMSLSYSRETNECLLSNELASDSLEPVAGWTSYTSSQVWSFFGNSSTDLHSQISILHQTVNNKILQELVPNDSELDPTSGATTDDINESVANFHKHVHQSNGVWQVFLYVPALAKILSPNRFQVEHSLNEPLNGDENEFEVHAANFHTGIVGKRFVEGIEGAREFRNALSYDQCALACIDADCASFSYCSSFERLCIVTDRYDVYALDSGSQNGEAKAMIVRDDACFIVQRDYLPQFNMFPGVPRSEVHEPIVVVASATDCAHYCIAETSFNCQAFDFCTRSPTSGECLLQKHKSTFAELDSSKPKIDTAASSCAHYARNYLADFHKLLFTGLNLKLPEVGSLQTMRVEVASVSACSEQCIVGELDCVAFEFCFRVTDNKKDGAADSAVSQTCTLLGGKVSVPMLTINSKGEVVKMTEMLMKDPECSFFALRADSSEAIRFRQSIVDEQKAGGDDQAGAAVASSTGLSVGGTFGLFFGVAVVFALVGAGYTVVMARNERLQDLLPNRLLFWRRN